jgi:hypothetical protein
MLQPYGLLNPAFNCTLFFILTFFKNFFTNESIEKLFLNLDPSEGCQRTLVVQNNDNIIGVLRLFPVECERGRENQSGPRANAG